MNKKTNNPIDAVITRKQSQISPFVFRPTHQWYRQIGITKKRFGAIRRGDISPTIDEIRVIALALGEDVATLLDSFTQTPAQAE